ncbi:hypothetical protein, partial [Plesiomonas shigelloides]|uniref:hypothetical protein n=1 Tax=Plesiomonas shigelloides TaxID=703 RepID=UPI001C498056
VDRPFAFDCANEHLFCATEHYTNKRKEYDLPVAANNAMPNRSVTAEITDRKENRITFAYSADTSTRPFAYNVQEWKEY